MQNFDISTYDDTIQKAIKIFEEDIKNSKTKQLQHIQSMQITLKEVYQDLQKLKNIITQSVESS